LQIRLRVVEISLFDWRRRRRRRRGGEIYII
jgi:hypothetical protein